jgi:hypothetical protein
MLWIIQSWHQQCFYSNVLSLFGFEKVVDISYTIWGKGRKILSSLSKQVLHYNWKGGYDIRQIGNTQILKKLTFFASGNLSFTLYWASETH